MTLITKHFDILLNRISQVSFHVCNSALGMIRRNIKKVPKPVREKLYQTLIRPQLEYASSAWSPWLKQELQDILELEKVQRRPAHFVHNNYWPLASVTQMISSLDWETLEARRQKARLTMLYKTINGSTTILMDHYQLSSATSTRSSHGQNFVLPSCRTDTYKHSFSLRRSADGTVCLDKMQVAISSSLQTFKSSIHNYIIN